jgi:hypothetical protein
MALAPTRRDDPGAYRLQNASRCVTMKKLGDYGGYDQLTLGVP